jgi:hypothetical protein
MAVIINLEKLLHTHIVLLNEISASIIEDFNELTLDIYEKSDKNQTWLFSSTLSRNPNQSKLFLHCCYLIFIERLIDNKEKIDKIIVPTEGLQKTILAFLKTQEITIKVGLSSNVSFKKVIKNMIRHLHGPYRNIKFCWRLYSSRNFSRKKSMPQFKPITLLDTFILSNSIKEGKYIDRYYPGLIENLSEDERESMFFIPTIIGKYSPKDLKKIFNASEENIVFKHDFLNFYDFFSAIISMMNYGRIKTKKLMFKDFNILWLIKEDLIKNQYNNSTLAGILNYRFFKRIKEHGVKLKMVVDWFENQPIDKGFNLGVHTFYPDIRHLGYKGYLISEDFNFYINPTSFEVSKHLIPKEIRVVTKVRS